MIRSPLQRLQKILIEPPAVIEDIALRHKARLLGAFLLGMIFVFLCVDSYYLFTVPGYTPPWYGYIFLFTAYFLNRIGYIRISAFLTMNMFPVVVFLFSATGDSPVLASAIYDLIPGLILAGILLSFRLTVLFAFFEIIVVLSMPFVAPKLFASPTSIVGPFSALCISALLVLTSIRHRDHVETERQALLRKNEERYRLISSVTSDYVFSNIQGENGDIVLNWVAGAFERISGYTVQEFNERGGRIARGFRATLRSRVCRLLARLALSAQARHQRGRRGRIECCDWGRALISPSETSTGMQSAVQRSFGSQIPREGTPPQMVRGPTSHGERSGEKSLKRQRQDPAFNRPDTVASSKPATTGTVRLDQQHSVNAAVAVTDRIG